MPLLTRVKSFLSRIGLEPGPRWKRVAIIMIAAVAGLGAYVLHISHATSYLTDDPQACVNCHIMMPQYATWQNSSHREVATCNGCHVPHNNIFNQYFFKAKDGLYHATIFTLRAEPQVIRALEPSRAVVQSNCIRCHQDQVADHKLEAFVEGHFENRTNRTCWDCHRGVPHGRINSLSAVGNLVEPIEVHFPDQQDVVPDWLEESMEEVQQKNAEE
jgi:cytochrome c nitrite reductase small subunit